jgi:REase_AHJR-like protein
MNAEAAEAQVLMGVIPELEAEGYDVFVHPRPPVAPAFLGDFQPDAIAIRADRKLVVEVVSRPGIDKKLQRLSSLLKDQPSWELRVILVSPTTVPEVLDVQPPAAIRQRITEMRKLADEGHPGPALLLGWASFEAASRSLQADEFKTAQTPGRLIDVLAGDGYLTPIEADQLRSLAKKRNAFAHGKLQAEISSKEVRELLSILETMLLMIEKGPENV